MVKLQPIRAGGVGGHPFIYYERSDLTKCLDLVGQAGRRNVQVPYSTRAIRDSSDAHIGELQAEVNVIQLIRLSADHSEKAYFFTAGFKTESGVKTRSRVGAVAPHDQMTKRL